MGDQLLLGAVLGSTLIPHVPIVTKAAVTPFPPGSEDGSTQTRNSRNITQTPVLRAHLWTPV